MTTNQKDDLSDSSAGRPSQGSSASRARSDSRLAVPLLSPIMRGRLLSPALDEFSLRRTPSRGTTASPVPARGVRKRLHQYHTFNDAVQLLKTSKNIVILTGAGISTSVGIPDFRSDKGLYFQLSKDLGITEAEEFFSKDYFVQNTEQFFRYVKRVIPEAVLGADGFFKPTNPATLAKDGRANVPKFSLTHAFLALLYSKQKLLTNYTQNIDGLELAAGLPRTKFVQCHGSWDTASCMTCGQSSSAKKYLPVVFSGNVPFCKCKLQAEEKSKRSKKKSSKKRNRDEFDSDHSSDDGTQAPRGLLKPDITFFNERLSGSYGDRLDNDKRRIDLLIIIGTSLKVGPVQDMLYQISAKVPQIFISKERFSGALCNLPGVQVDIELLGECDAIIEELCRRAGWSDHLDSLLWTRGETRIKKLNSRDTPLFSEPTHGNGEAVKMPNSMLNFEVRPQKRLKGDNTTGKLLSETNTPGTESDIQIHVNAAAVDVAAAAVSIPKKGEPGDDQQVSGINIKTSVRIKPEDPDMSAKTSAKGMSGLDTSASQLREGLETALEKRESRVKIELVEGTAHQWRVSRR